MLRRSLLIVGCLTLAGCGPRNRDLLTANKAFTDDLLARLPRLADAIDAMPLAPDAACQPPRKLSYAPKGDGDTDYVMYNDVRRAGKDAPDKKELDFHFSDGLFRFYLVWAQPASQNYIDRDGWGGKQATEGVRRIFENVKKLTHLIVVKPRPIDRGAGTVVIDTYLADLVTAKPLCGFSVTASVDPRLGVRSETWVTRKRSTGEEVSRREVTKDDFSNAVYLAARAEVFAKAAKQLGVATPQ